MICLFILKYMVRATTSSFLVLDDDNAVTIYTNIDYDNAPAI